MDAIDYSAGNKWSRLCE